MTRIIGSIVIKNEKDRYLESCLSWHKEFLDDIFVYDDRSDDGSAELAIELGCRTVRRSESRPSFIEHEGRFRASAWRAFEDVMKPEPGDWIFSFDADEFLVAPQNVRKIVDFAILKANRKNAVGVIIPFAEIFKIENEQFFYRTDGLWDTICGPRLFAYQTSGFWPDKAMGCGSEPSYVKAGPLTNQHQGLHILHLGYAKDLDKKEKFERYSSLLDHGHNNNHINSILDSPTLKLWEGQVPVL